MQSLWFVTPAIGRLDISAVCFPVLRWCLDRLPRGVEGNGIVVAHDENLDLAEQYGFLAYPQKSHPLGRKFNDGYQTALAEGADWVVPMCMDNWVHPDFFKELPMGRCIHTGSEHAIVRADGKRLAFLNVIDAFNPFGIGPFVIPRKLVENTGGRPVFDEAEYGIDMNTLDTIQKATPGGVTFHWQHLGPLKFVGFKCGENLTSYDDLAHFVKEETADVWTQLASVYPREFVEAAQDRGFDTDHSGP